MRDSTEAKHQALDSETRSLKHGDPATSENLPKNVSLKLYELMNSVVSKDVTPATVNAACQCASEIHKILKFNLELMRQDRRTKDVSSEPSAHSEKLSDVKLAKVKEVLERCGGNKTRAAESLGVSIRSLRDWVSAYESLAKFRFEQNE